MKHLTQNQTTTWKQAYEWSKLDEPKYICFGNLPNTKDGKEFFKPFLNAGYIHKDTLKFTGVFRLTQTGKNKIEQLLKETEAAL
jgi:hypothetical protein